MWRRKAELDPVPTKCAAIGQKDPDINKDVEKATTIEANGTESYHDH